MTNSKNVIDKFFLNVEYFDDCQSEVFEKKGSLHLHDTYTIIYFVKGGGFHEIDNNRYEIKDNDIFLLVPGQYHIVHELNKSRGYIIQFSEGYLYHQNSSLIHFLHYDILHKYNHLNLTDNEVRPIIEKYFELIYSENSIDDDELRTIIVRQLLICIVSRLAEIYTRIAPIQMYMDDLCTQFIKLVDLHYKEWHHLGEYIDALETTRKILDKKIFDKYGIKPIDIIHKKYVEHAIVLLLRTDMNVKGIAYILGFTDNSNFCKFFKEKTGLSPMEYRSKYGNFQE